MLKRLAITVVILVLTSATAFAYQAIRFNVSEGKAKERNDVFKDIVEVDLEDAGFTPKDIHPGVEYWYGEFYGNKLLDNGEENTQYKEDYVANLDNLGFITVSNEESMLPLLLKEPRLGAFAPFNYLIYKKKSQKKTYVGTLTPQAMLDIAMIKDKDVRRSFTKMIENLFKATDKGMGGKVEYIEIERLANKTMMEFEIAFERGEDVLEAKYDFMDRFEAAFEDEDYIIAGKRDFVEYWDDNDMKQNRFDAYWVYSLCHFEFSYTVFNVWQHPELGASAPCSMYMYLEKNTNTLKIGMPSVNNWITFGNIKDPDKIKYIKSMDEKIREIMISLGAKEI